MLKPTRIAAAIALALPVMAHAQSNADLIKEIEALKARIEQLEQQVKTAPAQAIDPDDFNRISTKAEALEDQRDANGFKGLKVNGSIDPTYIYNRDQNSAGFAFLNNFQTVNTSNTLSNGDAYAYDNSYFGMAILDLQKEMDGGTKWRLTLAPHKSAGSIYNFGSIVHEASGSIPLSDQKTRLMVGQVPDWSGYEYSFGYQNKLITHNLLFDFTVPAFYTGVGMDITRGPWEYKFLVANMNTPRYAPVDPSAPSPYSGKTPVLTGRFDYTKEEFWGVGGAFQVGKAPNYLTNSTTSIGLAEVDGYFTRGVWNVQGQLAYGGQKAAATNGGDASWWGASGLVSYNFTPQFVGVARLDYLYDQKNGGGLLTYSFADGRNGIGPGFVLDPTSGTWVVDDPNKGANKYALSLGLNYLFNQFTTFKVEYRYDRASQAVFKYVNDGSYKKDNQVFGLSTVVSF